MKIRNDMEIDNILYKFLIRGEEKLKKKKRKKIAGKRIVLYWNSLDPRNIY